VKESIPEHLNSQKYAQWSATIILPDELFKAYEVWVEMKEAKPSWFVREMHEV